LFCRVIDRFFDLAASVFGRRGARVERLIGDGVLAVFGLPGAHEDDALRAIGSALELQEGIAGLNQQLATETAVALTLRTGVNSGEVLLADTGAEPGLISGAAVNLALRLERRAGEGEIVIDPITWQLVRDAVRTEPLAATAFEEGAERAFRLLSLVEGAPAFARRLDAPLVGREQELAQMRRAFRRCAAEQTAFLFTILGAAGIGKSRLALEARLELVEQARVADGRC